MWGEEGVVEYGDAGGGINSAWLMVVLNELWEVMCGDVCRNAGVCGALMQSLG